jgi:DNA-binding XRE family transcriptional regulator
LTYLSHELRKRGVDPEAIQFREWRRSRQLRQWQAAKLAGVSGHTVLAFETGRRPISDSARAKLRALYESGRDKCWCRGIPL